MKITEILPIEKTKENALPIYLTRVEAGFPSPADDFIDRKLDLNEYLIQHPAATFFVRVSGDSMKEAGIHSGDLLIVDRSLTASDQKIVIASIHGELTVKRLRKIKNEIFLMPENSSYPPIPITEEMAFEVWGVVTFVIHSL